MENVISSLVIFGNKCLHNRTMFSVVFWHIILMPAIFQKLETPFDGSREKGRHLFCKYSYLENTIILCKIWGQLTNPKLHVQILL